MIIFLLSFFFKITATTLLTALPVKAGSLQDVVNFLRAVVVVAQWLIVTNDRSVADVSNFSRTRAGLAVT